MDPLPKKIAVIAVHGVGDQQPYDSAHRIADLLQSLDAGTPPVEPASPECPAYFPFHEHTIRLDVRPTVVRDKASQPATSNTEQAGANKNTALPDGAGMRGPFDAWVSARFKEKKEDVLSDDDLWYEFTRSQLRLYRGEEPENTYGTIRVEGRRAKQKGAGGKEEEERDVHIYELYWADLSRLKAGALSVFTELYQLLLHLPSLGTHVVNTAAAHHAKSSGWRAYKWLQGASAMMLALPILVTNLLMVAMVLLVLGLAALNKHKETQEPILASAIAVVLVILFGLWWWHTLARHSTPSAPEWPDQGKGTATIKTLLWIATLGLGGGIGFLLYLAFCKYNLPLEVIASVLLASALGMALWLVLNKYDARRPGSKRGAAFIFAVILLVGAVTVLAKSPSSGPLPNAMAITEDCPSDRPAGASVLPDAVVSFWVREFEVADIALGIAWASFFCLSLVTVIIGRILAGIADRKSAGTAPRPRFAYRSWWTGVLMLAIPALSFLITTSVFWLLIAEAVWKTLPNAVYQPLLMRAEMRTVLDLACVVKTDLEGVVGILLPFAALALIPAIWGLVPVGLQEAFPPCPPREWTQDAKEQWSNRAMRLGRWLTLAFAGLKLSGQILYLGTMLFLPFAATAYVFKAHGIVDLLAGLGLGTSPGWFSWFSGLGLFAFVFFRGRWKKALPGFRYVLDMLLDVDNWLREHPRTSNPKSRICGRYVSLLRYIANWKDEPELVNGVPVRRGYHAIIIIAHSQGTVITADLLRFLKRQADGNFPGYDSQLAPIAQLPIYLFTMGCPLRQLYGLRFPHLYHWARHDSTELMSKWGEKDLQGSPAPDPRKLLQVQLWENCYRSGDYIGRYLWRSDACSYTWEPDPCGFSAEEPQQYNSTDGLCRSEFCIGPGAHTHYWDATANVVAKELDRIIAAV